MSETTHSVEHYPAQRFMFFLQLWAVEWERQEGARWSLPYLQQIQRELDRLEGKVEAYQ